MAQGVGQTINYTPPVFFLAQVIRSPSNLAAQPSLPSFQSQNTACLLSRSRQLAPRPLASSGMRATAQP
jgi:hypothetical protein